MPQQFISGLIILLSLITATGLPWQLCHKTGQPYLINLLMSTLIILVHLWFARGSISSGDRGNTFDRGRGWKIGWTRTIPGFGLILWSILRGFYIHPYGFRIEDGWFSAIGLCFLLDRSPLKHLLQRTIITMSPLAIISLYGWLCPSSVITGLLIIAFAVSFVAERHRGTTKAQRHKGDVGADLCVCPLRGNNQGVEGIRRGRPLCLPSFLRNICDAWAGRHKSSCLCVFVVKYLATAVFMAAFIGISLHFLLFDPGIKKQGRILFDIGHGDTSGPQWGYNTDIDKSADAGHGRLLDFLATYGYKVETRSEPLRQDMLKKYDILLLIMPSHAYTRQEIKNIEKFVQDGGGLMVIGDHTNVDDVMASLNPVLEGFGIKLKFDIVRVDKQIKANIFAAHCPGFQGINPVRETAIGNGASLSLSSPGVRGMYSPLIRGGRGVFSAMPILSVGYGAFSDIGDMKTGPDQAYLGNGMLDKSERVGDHVLAASGKYGQGRLIVFGDSSYFQNLALYRNYQFAYQCFEWLNRKNIDTKRWALSLFLLFLLLLLLSAAVIIYGQGIWVLGYGIIPALIIAQCISSAVNHHSYPVIDYKKLGQRVLFDFAHYPEHRTYWEDTDNYPTSLDSLVHQTLRVGLHPSLRYRGRLNAQTLKGYDALVVSSPNLPYTRGEVQSIQQWVHSGGGLLVIEGAREQAAINTLLEPFKIRLDDKPLGTYYCEKDTDGNDFKIPMSFTTQKFINHPITQGVNYIWFMTPVAVKGGIPLAYVYDYPTMVYKKYGAGRVVVAGDDLFFANYISEGEKGVVDYDKVLLNWNLMRWLVGGKYNH